MKYKSNYCSPMGEILIAADEEGITGLWFYGQKYFGAGLKNDAIEFENDHIKAAKKWLNCYFEKKEPEVTPKLHLNGTEFRKKVWEILLDIPYGEVCTYGDIANKMADIMGLKTMSAQAVGGAVGHNPISIIVPCHRVVGKGNNLTGYAGGLDKKSALLSLENSDIKVL